MKKITQLLIAIFAITPSFLAAEEKSLDFFSSATISPGTLQYKLTKDVNRSWDWQGLVRTNNYGLGNAGSLTEMRRYFSTENQGIYVKFTVPEDQQTGVYFQGGDPGFFSLPANSPVRISIPRGKITKVEVQCIDNGSNISNFIPTDGTTALFNGTNTYTLSTTNPQGIVTFNYGSSFKFNRITVFYDDAGTTLPKPEPFLRVREELGYKYNEAAKTLQIPHFYSETAAASYFTASPFEDISYTFSNINFSETVSWDRLSSFTDFTSFSNPTTHCVSIAQNIGIRYNYAFNPDDATLGKDTPQTMRYASKNVITGEWSDVKTVKVSTYRFPTPGIDLDKMRANNITARNFQWNADTKTLYYSGWNPVVYFINTTPVVEEQYNIRYTTGFVETTPTVSSGESYDDTKGILFANGNGENIIPSNGDKIALNYWAWRQQDDNQMRNPIVEQDNAIYYTPAKGTYETIILECYDNNDPTAPTITINAPEISVTALTTTLSGGVLGYIDPSIVVDIKATHNWVNESKGELQYQWAESWELEPTGEWLPVKNNKFTVSGVGRLFVREFKDGCVSAIAYQDFRYLDNTVINDLAPQTLSRLEEGAVVRINTTMWVRGGYTTTNVASAGHESGMVFITDKNGNAIRINSEFAKGDANKSFILGENAAIPAGGLIGVLTGQKNGLPELSLTGTGKDEFTYIPFLKGTTTTLGPAPAIQETYKLELKDFSKLMLFTKFRWNVDDDGAEYFTDSDGNKAKAFPRLKSSPDWYEIKESLAPGVDYRIMGYVGFNDGEPVILPLAVVPGLRLLAPNPINPEAAPGEYITMNVISPELYLTVNPEGVDKDAEVQYVFSDDKNLNWANTINWNDKSKVKSVNAITGTIEVTKAELSDGGCTLAARLVSDGLASGIVTVRFNKVDVKPENHLMAISSFKDIFLDEAVITDPTKKENANKIEYFQYHGHAQVRDIFGKYLYIRDVPADTEEFGYDELSSHSILLYNDYGWETVVAMEENDPSTGAEGIDDDFAPRPLKPGDIITNFALIPYRTGYGNLVGYATGFARTLRRTRDIPIHYEAENLNVQDNDVRGFAETDRMLMYNVRRVKVLRTGTIGNYTYTLDMPGKPVLNVGGIYPAIRNWDVIWSPDVIYNLEGVVMLADGDIPEGNDGRYMLALKDFSLSDVKTPDAPRIYLLKGPGVDLENGTFINTAQVQLESRTAASNDDVDIWYTLDGTDPRTSETAIKYDLKKTITINRNRVIKAYVLANGMPNSEVADTLFTRTGVDCPYLINFITDARENVPYRITANVRVVGKGGKYIFVRGTQGHYLPVSFEDQPALNKLRQIKVGHYINDFVATAHKIKTSDGEEVVRGAHVEGTHVELFGALSAKKPDNINEINIEPDTVRTITVANARRYVKILGVKLEGVDFNSADATNRDLSWTLKTNKGEGHYDVIRVNNDNLEYEYDWNSTDQTAAAYYNVSGFAMLGLDGQIEIWPTQVEKVKTPKLIEATYDSNISYKSAMIDGLQTVTFYPHTTVTLNAVKGATIYYQICNTEQDDIDETKWNKYGQPFTIARSCFIHAYSTAPGYEQSGHTHLQMTLGDESTKISGALRFSHRLNDQGNPVITIEPEDKNIKPGTYTIYYTTDGSTPTLNSTRYIGEFELPGGGLVFAILKETNKEPGKIANYNVWNAPSAIHTPTTSTPVQIQGNNIIAPQGTKVYDLTGTQVRHDGLRPGIYIVRIPGASPLKILIK